MSAFVLTTLGRAVMAQTLSTLPFVFAVSAGDPDWDAAWAEPNPPVPPLASTDVLDLIGYARPSIVGFVAEDADGVIVTEEGTAWSTSAVRTRNLRLRVSIPAGAWSGQTIREIGVFANPTFAAGLAPGKTILDLEDVLDAGDLMHVSWLRPQFLSPGTSLIRDFILRV